MVPWSGLSIKSYACLQGPIATRLVTDVAKPSVRSLADHAFPVSGFELHRSSYTGTRPTTSKTWWKFEASQRALRVPLSHRMFFAKWSNQAEIILWSTT